VTGAPFANRRAVAFAYIAPSGAKSADAQPGF